MMKKSILFALLGGLILFVWLFISFAMPNLHKAGMEYTPSQDEVLAALEKAGLEEGMYMLGQPNPELSKEEYKTTMETYMGKPWAILNYQAENTDKMAMNMVRGYIICILIAFFFFWLVRQQKDPSLGKRIMLGLGVGMIGFFFVPYTNFIWFREPDIWAHLLDGTVPWLVLGWLGHKMA